MTEDVTTLASEDLGGVVVSVVLIGGRVELQIDVRPPAFAAVQTAPQIRGEPPVPGVSISIRPTDPGWVTRLGALARYGAHVAIWRLAEREQRERR